MRRFLIAAPPLVVLAAGDAAAQRALTPGQFFTGLTSTGAEALAAQARADRPGTVVDVAYDIGLGTWTVDVRKDSANDTTSPEK
jgi:hypothetical protein